MSIYDSTYNTVPSMGPVVWNFAAIADRGHNSIMSQTSLKLLMVLLS